MRKIAIKNFRLCMTFFIIGLLALAITFSGLVSSVYAGNISSRVSEA